MCYIECHCRSVRIEFHASEPLVTAECCCHDCLRRLEHTCRAGGRTLPKEFADRSKALVLNYLENDLEVVRGKDKLRFFKLRVDGLTTNMSCSECSSLLLFNHPSYKGNVVCTLGGDLSVNETDIREKPPAIRWFVKDWPEDKVNKLDPLPAFWLADGEPSGSGGGLETYAKIVAMVAMLVKSEDKRDTFEAILANHKGGIEMADAGLGSKRMGTGPENRTTAAA